MRLDVLLMIDGEEEVVLRLFSRDVFAIISL
jgi:hypothetical protein